MLLKRVATRLPGEKGLLTDIRHGSKCRPGRNLIIEHCRKSRPPVRLCRWSCDEDSILRAGITARSLSSSQRRTAQYHRAGGFGGTFAFLIRGTTSLRFQNEMGPFGNGARVRGPLLTAAAANQQPPAPSLAAALFWLGPRSRNSPLSPEIL